MKFSYQWLKELNPKIPNKAKLVEALNLYSFETENKAGDLLEISIPPNRFSDAASHLGIAKEAAAVLELQSPAQKIRTAAGGKNSKSIKIQIEDNNLCPRYCAKVVRGLKVTSSPKWLAKRLKTCGLRPINNIVDAMNYVMLETGQPLHAFDLDKLANKEIIIRRAKKGEKITTLDDEVYDLDKNVLVIADSKNALAIAGIKGGHKAEITAKTKNIVIEAANFDPVNIYQTSKRLKLITDASLRFSHGLSIDLPEFAIERAAALVLELAGGRADKGIIDIYNPKIAGRQRDLLDIDFKKLKNFLGIEIEKARIKKVLNYLGFEVKDLGSSLRVKPPVFRLDITIPEDVYEEIVRIYGYEKIFPSPPKVFLGSAIKDEKIEFSDKVRAILRGLGYSEVYNYSFISGKEAVSNFWTKDPLEIENPISRDLSYLRNSLSYHLIKNTENNLRFLDGIKLFEIGEVFLKENNSTKESLNLGLVFAKKAKSASIARHDLFLELKGVAESLLRQLGLVDYLFVDLDKTISWLDKKLAVRLESDGSVLGYLGIVANSETLAAIFEINLEKLLVLIEGEREYRPLSKFPSVMRDISILVNRETRFSEVLNIIYDAGVKFIDDVDLIDIYESEDLSEGQKSLTFRIVFQAEDHTLTDQEVGKEMEKIIRALRDNLGAEIR